SPSARSPYAPAPSTAASRPTAPSRGAWICSRWRGAESSRRSSGRNRRSSRKAHGAPRAVVGASCRSSKRAGAERGVWLSSLHPRKQPEREQSFVSASWQGASKGESFEQSSQLAASKGSSLPKYELGRREGGRTLLEAHPGKQGKGAARLDGEGLGRWSTRGSPPIVLARVKIGYES